MKIKKIMSGVFAAALLLMGGQTAFCVQGTNNTSNQNSGTNTAINAAYSGATVTQKEAVVGASAATSSAVAGAVSSPSGGSTGAATNAIGSRIDDHLSTMMAIYQQRKEYIAQKSMTQPVGPAGSGAQVRIDKLQKAWGRYTSTWGDQNSINGNGGYDFVSHGPVFGYDKFITDRFLVGGLFGYSRTEVEADGGAEVDVNSYMGGVYGSYLFSDVDYLNFVFSYARSNIDSSNTISGLGSMSGDTDANGWVVVGEYGHKFLLKNSFIVTPVAGFVLSLSDVEGYKTSVTGTYKTEEYADSKTKFFSSRIGVKGDWLFSPTGTLKAKALWMHEYSSDNEPVTEVRYGTQSSFVNVKGLDPGRDKGLFSLGLKYGFMNGIVLDIDADFTVGEEYEAWTTSGKIEYPF